MAKLMPEFGVIPGLALDMSVKDAEGEYWNFTRYDHRKEARRLRAEQRPLFLIGPPPCTEVSSWQALNAAKCGWSPEEIRRRRSAAELHLRFVCSLYKEQINDGAYFLHEHPDGAASWGMACVQGILMEDKVVRVKKGVSPEESFGNDPPEGGHPG